MSLQAELNERIAILRDRFAALQPREQAIVTGGAVVLTLLLLWVGLWLPLQQWRHGSEQALLDGREHARELEREAAVAADSASGGGAMGRSVSLLTAVDQASHQGGLTTPPTRLQPEGDTRVRVWFTDVPFETLNRWIAFLHEQFGIDVETADIEHKATPGVVDARLSLVR